MSEASQNEGAGKPAPGSKAIKDTRRLGREFALQYLFQTDLGGDPPSAKHLSNFWNQLKEARCFPQNRNLRFACEFAEKTIYGVHGVIEEIDKTISGYSKGWSLERIAAIDRNIMRIAIYEIFRESSIPALVSVSEAMRLHEKYGSEETRSFVNGILNAVMGNSGGDPRKGKEDRKK